MVLAATSLVTEALPTDLATLQPFLSVLMTHPRPLPTVLLQVLPVEPASETLDMVSLALRLNFPAE